MNIIVTLKHKDLICLSLSKILCIIVILSIGFQSNLFAQPSNDNCSGATSLSIANDEESIVWTTGTTIGTVDAALVSAPPACSSDYYRDDVWYKIKLPNTLPNKLLTIKILPLSIWTVGFAIYLSNSCSEFNEPYFCTSTYSGEEKDNASIGIQCFTPGQEILIRVWSNTGTKDSWKDGEGSFKISAFFDDYIVPGNILWGSNGEGTFDNGLNNWTTTSNSCNNYQLWFWSKDTMCTKGAYSSGGGTISSMTACNGAACFDSDYYDSGGNQGNMGIGPCPAPQSGTLESPTIDLGAYTFGKSVVLVFSQALRQFLSNYYVEYSYDNGSTWTTKEINMVSEDEYLYSPNGPFVNNTRRIIIPNAGGQSQFKIRFRFEANYYFWIIDDVYITELEDNLRIKNAIAIAPYKIWQYDQLADFGGLAEVQNIGSNTANNIDLKLEIYNSDSTVFWIDSMKQTNLLVDSSSTILINKDFKYPTNIENLYTGKYILKQDLKDFHVSDNIQTFNWEVSNNVMAKEDIGVNGSGVRPYASASFTWGNIYHIVTNIDSKTNHNYQCQQVQVGIANPEELAGKRIYVWIYKWDNLNNDSLVQENERTNVGIGFYDFKPNELPNTLFSIHVYDYNTLNNCCYLDSNTNYIVTVQYIAPSNNPDQSCYILCDRNLNYNSNYLRSLLKSPNEIQYNHVIDVGNTGIFGATTFTSGDVPVVRMVIGPDSLKSLNSLVRGRVYCDFDCDSIFNMTDEILRYKLIYDNQTGIPISTTDYSGNYTLGLKDQQNLKFSLKKYKGYTLHPMEYVISNDTSGKKYIGYDFRLCPDSLFHDIKVNIISLENPRPGFKHSYKIGFENIGTQHEDATLIFKFLDSQGNTFTSIDNADGGQIIGDEIKWNITDLNLFKENNKEIELTIKQNIPIGTILRPFISLVLNNGLTDIDPGNNIDSLKETIVGSYDPNEKTVNKDGFTSAELAKGVSLEYLIRFQNTGNYPASFIDVYDTLANTLDIRSLVMITASHPYTLSFPSPNVLKWRFDNINLPDSTSNEVESHGYIKFKINTKPNLTKTDVISNTAAIYFDFNTPVITNTIKTSFVVATHNLAANNNLPVMVYPNPVSNITQVKYSLPKRMNCRMELMDPTGRLVLVKGADLPKGEQTEIIDMTDYTSGVYFLRLYTEEGMGEATIVKQ